MEDRVEILVLNQSEVAVLISAKEAVDVINGVWKAIAAGQVTQAGKDELATDPPRNRNRVIAPRACIIPTGAFGIKWVTRFLDRPPGTALHYGVIVLSDIRDGKPVAVMDAQLITHIRTGANAAVAGKYLAKKSSKVIAIIGCGQEARAHLAAFASLFDLTTVRIYDISPKAVAAFKEEMAGKVPDAEIVPAASPEETVADADIVCMVTTANEPIVLESWIPRGCFVAGTAQFRDLDVKLAKTADKFVIGYSPKDKPFLFQAHPQLGELISPDEIYAEMTDIVSGEKPGRENDDERILYIHSGSGALDVAIAHLVYIRAKEHGLGIRVRII